MSPTPRPYTSTLQTPKNVQGFAEQLLAVNENAFRGMAGKSPHGGRACLADWGVRLEARVEGTAEDPRTVLGEVAASRDEDQEEEDGGSGSERFAGDDTQHAWRPDGEVSQDTLDADADVDVAPAGRLPFMEATLLQTECTEESAGARTAGNDGAGAPIPPLEAGALASYAGLPGAVALRRAFGGSGASSGLAAGGASASPRPPSPSASDAAGGFEEEGSRHGGRGAGAASISRASDWGTESATSGLAGGAPTAGAGRVQDPRNGGSGQPPMAVDEDDDDDFFDSDDDEAFLAAALPGGAAAAAAVAAAAAPARWAGVAVGRAHAFPRISGCNVHGRNAQTATIRSLRDPPLFAIPACRAAGAAGTEPVDLLATGSRTPPSLASTHSGSKRFSFNIREGEGNVAGAAAAPSLKAAVQVCVVWGWVGLGGEFHPRSKPAWQSLVVGMGVACMLCGLQTHSQEDRPSTVPTHPLQGLRLGPPPLAPPPTAGGSAVRRRHACGLGVRRK